MRRKTKTYHAVISVTVMTVLIFTSVVGYHAQPQIPLIFGCFIAGLVALWAGYSWTDILDGIVSGVSQAIEAVLILLLIGVLVGSWISSGTVPTIIYYGLKIISAKYFLFTAVLLCGLVSFVIGAWGTVGTVGLAFMGIGTALGLPAPLVAGGVITGAYFGEIVSPLSDATNLTAAVVDCNVLGLMKKTLPISLAALALAEITYLIVGLRFGDSNAVQIADNITPLIEGLDQSFVITPLALIPMLIMLVSIAFKCPAIPAMLIGSIAGIIGALTVQGADPADLFETCFSGYVGDTGVETLDALLTAGGLESMMEAVSIIIIAMGFGGLMQHTEQMEALITPIAHHVKSRGGIEALTVFSCVCMNIILPDQYLGISVPGQMLAQEYDKRGMPRLELSRALLCGGAVTSPLIPWNTCGIYCAGILNISTMEYLPYAYLSILLPIMLIVMCFVSQFKHKAENARANR